MAVDIKGSLRTVKNMVKESIGGLIKVILMVLGKKMNYLVMASITGMMDDPIVEIGYIIRCMEKEYINGRMEGGMKVTILMIGNTAMESIIGPMVGSLRESGFMESVKAREN